jgi:hypothetical protein
MLNNNNDYFCYLIKVSKYIKQNSIILLLLLLSLSLFSFNNNDLAIFGQSSNSHIGNEDLNIVAVGDFYCNGQTEDIIKNIISVNPELIIPTRDHVKDEKSAKCWIEMSEPIKDIMKIAIGNHDRESSKIFKQITKNHNLKIPYYSHDFKNIHFISLSTEHPFGEGSKQYEFIKNDRENLNKFKY